MTAPVYAPSSQAGLASFRESPTEYNARIEQLRAELADIAVQAAVLAERARGLAGVRPDMAGAA